MRTFLLTLVFAAAAVAPTGCAFGFRSEVGRDNEHPTYYAPAADPVGTPVAAR